MKKIALTLTIFFGFSIASYACQAAWDNIEYEVEQFGPFDNWHDALEAMQEWIEISC